MENRLANSLNKLNGKIGWTNWVDKLCEKKGEKLGAKFLGQNCVKKLREKLSEKMGGKIVHCTLYIVQYSFYSVQCTVYSVQCTTYSKTQFQIKVEDWCTEGYF